ncbi:MAG: glucose-6-phosphate isomerase [Rhodobacterales bacterium]|nr:MAG: glucose-6-phosphate isomerase [Rhodobacterales bacterium]
MKTKLIALACAASIGLAGCYNTLTADQKMAVGALGGAAAGMLAADLLDANKNWTVVAALAGAAAGTMVARNYDTGTCAYARGDGTYYEAPCR